MLRLRHLPHTCPNIRLTEFGAFVNILAIQWPVCFGHVRPHDQKTFDTYLRGGLCLSPEECLRTTLLIRRHFGLTHQNEILLQRVLKHDITLGDLYRQLWFEAVCWENSRL